MGDLMEIKLLTSRIVTTRTRVKGNTTTVLITDLEIQEMDIIMLFLAYLVLIHNLNQIHLSILWQVWTFSRHLLIQKC